MSHNPLGADAIEWLGTHYRNLLTGQVTDGAMSIVDTVSPPGSGPPRHIHHDADETFVMLSGDCEFWLDGDRFVRGPGQAVFVPRGREHAFRVTSDIPSRHLIILTPGGFEGFFAEMAAGGYRITHDMAAIQKIGQRFHLTFTGPPLRDD